MRGNKRRAGVVHTEPRTGEHLCSTYLYSTPTLQLGAQPGVDRKSEDEDEDDQTIEDVIGHDAIVSGFIKTTTTWNNDHV